MRPIIAAALLAALFANAPPVLAGTPDETFSYVGRLQAPALYEPPETCCFDLDGDTTVDDAFGNLLGLLATLAGADWQAAVDEGIEDGSLVLLLRWDQLPAALGDGPVDFRATSGSFQPLLPPLADRLAGLGTAVFDPDSAGQPFVGMLSGGNLAAMDGTLRIPGLVSADGPLAVDVEIDVIEGGLALDPPGCSGVCSEDEASAGGPAVRGGLRLGGALHADNYFGALDARYRQCSCAGIDPGQPVISFGEGASQYQASCTGNTGTPGDCVEDDFCAALATFCSTIGVTANLLDLDRNNNGIEDAFSLGLRISLSGVTVSGDTTAIFNDGFEDLP